MIKIHTLCFTLICLLFVSGCAGTLHLQIDSTPGEAEVIEDGVVSGVTPFKVKIPITPEEMKAGLKEVKVPKIRWNSGVEVPSATVTVSLSSNIFQNYKHTAERPGSTADRGFLADMEYAQKAREERIAQAEARTQTYLAASAILLGAVAVANAYNGGGYTPASTYTPYQSYTPASYQAPISSSRYHRSADLHPYAGSAPKLYADDGTYLGRLSSDEYHPESISNEYGKYGSEYSPTSINNEYGRFGNPYTPIYVVR